MLLMFIILFHLIAFTTPSAYSSDHGISTAHNFNIFSAVAWSAITVSIGKHPSLAAETTAS